MRLGLIVGGLLFAARPGIGRRRLEAFRFLIRNPCLGEHRRIDPARRIDGRARSRNLERQLIRPGEIDRLAHAVIERADNVDAVRADTVAHRKKIVVAIGAESEVLHRARSAREGAVAGMGDAERRGYLSDARQLDDREIAVIVHPQEGVEPALHTVHVEQGDQRKTHHFGEKGDMAFDVGGHDRDMMDAGRMLVHAAGFPC